jgi:hypothetical protein
VEPGRAGRPERGRLTDRVGSEDGLSLEVALLESDDPAAAEVDCRDHRER